MLAYYDLCWNAKVMTGRHTLLVHQERWSVQNKVCIEDAYGEALESLFFYLHYSEHLTEWGKSANWGNYCTDHETLLPKRSLKSGV